MAYNPLDLYQRNAPGVQVYTPGRSFAPPPPPRQQWEQPTGKGNSGVTRGSRQSWKAAVLSEIGDGPTLGENESADSSGGASAWGKGLGILIGNPITQAAMKPLEFLDHGRRLVASTIKEGADALTSPEDVSFDDFQAQIRDESFGARDILPQTGNSIVDSTLGFVGDVATDPLSYASFGIGGVAAKGTAVAGRAARAARLAKAADKLRKSGGLTDDAIKGMRRTAQRGFGSADDALLDTMELGQQGLRLEVPFSRMATGPLPGTQQAGKAVNKVFGGAREALNKTRPVQRLSHGKDPKGLEKAMKIITSGEGSNDDFLRALTVVQADNLRRPIAGKIVGIGSQQLDRTVKEIETFIEKGGDVGKMILDTEQGVNTPITRLTNRLYALAKKEGVILPRIEGTGYVPHVLGTEFRDLLATGDARAQKFINQAGLVNENLMRDSGFLSARMLRPKNGKPLRIKIDDRVIDITDGTIDEINTKVAHLFPELKSSALETDPRVVFERYIEGIAEDTGQRYARKELIKAGNPFIKRLDDAAPGARRTVDGQDPFADDEFFRGVKDDAASAKANEQVADQARETMEAERFQADRLRQGEEGGIPGVAGTLSTARSELRDPMVARRGELASELGSEQPFSPAAGGKMGKRLEAIRQETLSNTAKRKKIIEAADEEIAALKKEEAKLRRKVRSIPKQVGARGEKAKARYIGQLQESIATLETRLDDATNAISENVSGRVQAGYQRQLDEMRDVVAQARRRADEAVENVNRRMAVEGMPSVAAKNADDALSDSQRVADLPGQIKAKAAIAEMRPGAQADLDEANKVFHRKPRKTKAGEYELDGYTIKSHGKGDWRIAYAGEPELEGVTFPTLKAAAEQIKKATNAKRPVVANRRAASDKAMDLAEAETRLGRQIDDVQTEQVISDETVRLSGEAAPVHPAAFTDEAGTLHQDPTPKVVRQDPDVKATKRAAERAEVRYQREAIPADIKANMSDDEWERLFPRRSPDSAPTPRDSISHEQFLRRMVEVNRRGGQQHDQQVRRAAGLAEEVGARKTELNTALRQGDELPKPANAKMEAIDAASEEEIVLRQMLPNLGEKQAHRKAGAKFVESRKQAKTLDDKNTQLWQDFDELSENAGAMQVERGQVRAALAESPTDPAARMRDSLDTAKDGGLRPPSVKGASTLVDNAELQPLYQNLEEIESMARANPNLSDDALRETEALLQQQRRLLDQVSTHDIKANQAQQILNEASKGEFVDVMLAELRETYRMMPEGDVVIAKELSEMMGHIADLKKAPGILGSTLTAFTNFFKTYATMTPGFHVRNAMSAVFMNSADGVPLMTTRRGLSLWTEFVNADDPAKWMAGQPKKVQQAFDAAFGSGTGGRFFESGVGEATAIGRTKLKEGIFRNRATIASQKAGQNWVEGPVRLGVALDTIGARGGSVDDALQRITRLHFDYSQVSSFDEQAKKMIPFWTFMSRNLPMQITEMWTKPRLYAQYNSFTRNFGVDPVEYTPEYILEAGGFNTGEKLAGLPLYLQPDFAHTRVTEDVEKIENVLSGENPAQLLADFNPMFTAPLEFGMGQNLYTGRRYKDTDYRKASGPIDMAMLPLLAFLGQTKKGADGVYLSEKAVDAMNSVNPLSDRASRLVPAAAGEAMSDRQIESWARYMGVPIRQISPQQQQAQQRNEFYDAQDQQAMQRVLAGGG